MIKMRLFQKCYILKTAEFMSHRNIQTVVKGGKWLSAHNRMHKSTKRWKTPLTLMFSYHFHHVSALSCPWLFSIPLCLFGYHLLPYSFCLSVLALALLPCALLCLFLLSSVVFFFKYLSASLTLSPLHVDLLQVQWCIFVCLCTCWSLSAILKKKRN